MGATDNAFIKAYEDAEGTVAMSQRSRQIRAGIQDDQAAITVDASLTIDRDRQRPLHSQVVAGSNMSRPRNVELPTGIDDHPAPTHERIPRPHFDLSAFAEAAAAKTNARTLQHAAVRSAMLNQGVAKSDSEVVSVRGNGTFDRVGVTEREWIPEWEVDRFRWPDVCEQLHQKNTDRVTNIVRPLLHAAWRGRNVVGVTSFARGEGATTAALCMARTAASFNVPTVLVDGDTNQRAIGKMLGISFEQGWNDKTIPLPEAAVGSTEDRLVVMPAAEGTADISRTLCLVQELASRFELVIIDTGPIFTAAHHWFEQPICSMIHNAIVVQDIRSTAAEELDDVHSRLSKSGMLDVAIVENFALDI